METSGGLLADTLASSKCQSFSEFTIPFQGTLEMPAVPQPEAEGTRPSSFTVLAGGHFFAHPGLAGRALVWRIKSEGQVLELVEQPLLAVVGGAEDAHEAIGLRAIFADDEIVPPVLLCETRGLIRVIIVCFDFKTKRERERERKNILLSFTSHFLFLFLRFIR